MSNKIELNDSGSITQNGYVLSIDFSQWLLEDVDSLFNDYYISEFFKKNVTLINTTAYAQAYAAVELEAQNLLQELRVIPSLSEVKTLADVLSIADKVRSLTINPSLYSLTYADEVNDDGEREVYWSSVTSDKFPLLSLLSAFSTFRWGYSDLVRSRKGMTLEKLKKDLEAGKEKHSRLENDLKDCMDKKFVDNKLKPSLEKIQKLEESVITFKELPDFSSWVLSIFKGHAKYEKALNLLFKVGTPSLN